jgi:DNA gyrase/topoisomerase IV subunit A
MLFSFSFATVRRRTAHRLAKLQTRDHVVQGMIRALGRIDDIIQVMKTSKDAAQAKELLGGDKFGFSPEQVRAGVCWVLVLVSFAWKLRRATRACNLCRPL